MEMKIKLRHPRGNQNHGIEIFNGPENCRFLMDLPEVKAARGFLQCESRDYVFIEFWTDEQPRITAAFYAVKNRIDSELTN